MESLWLLATAGGALILGFGLFYGMTRATRLNRRDADRRDAGTKRVYEDDARGDRV